MDNKRQSVMVLPKNGSKILLQAFTDTVGDTVWDGFGGFYSNKENPPGTAEAVCLDYFKTLTTPLQLTQRAQLNYLINKPTGLVDLDVTVYFIDLDGSAVTPSQAQWFEPNKIPYAQMHQATGKWLPLLLNGGGNLNAKIMVDQPGDHAAGVVTSFTVN